MIACTASTSGCVHELISMQHSLARAPTWLLQQPPLGQAACIGLMPRHTVNRGEEEHTYQFIDLMNRGRPRHADPGPATHLCCSSVCCCNSSGAVTTLHHEACHTSCVVISSDDGLPPGLRSTAMDGASNTQGGWSWVWQIGCVASGPILSKTSMPNTRY